MNPVIGQLVYSKAGRDQGRIFVVFDILDGNYVYIVDGSLRKIEKPKKKKVKHLKIIDEVSYELAEKIKQGKKIMNSDIRKYIETNTNIIN